MNTQSDIQQEKVKANGKWATMKDAVRDSEKEAATLGKEVVTKGQEILEIAQDHAADLLESGGKFAKATGDKAIKLAKTYPVQTAVGGIALGIFIGSRIFGQRNK